MNEPLLGARWCGAGTRFGTYTSGIASCAVRLFGEDASAIATHPMHAVGGGHWEAFVPEARPGSLYKFVLDGRELPDPFARWLPRGVHGPAAVVSPEYTPRHSRVATPLAEQVVYELHVGTFTTEGTYEAARGRLAYLADLGVRAIELMPVAAFAGSRGWGYDGVAHYAPFAPYGSPDELRRLVDAAHGHGLGVILDVVYNHFGPAGNYLAAYSPDYFVRAATPWGEAPNFANKAMRRYVVENALFWLKEFGFDGLRLDATHAILDTAEDPVLPELTRRVKEVGGTLLFAEDERNEPAVVTSVGFDAVWADDFHHQVRVTLTGERDGYYGSYTPGARGLAEAIEQGWIYEGQLYQRTGRGRGKPARDLPAEAFVYCVQNHDQIGNRAFGDRLGASVSAEAYRSASMLLLFLPMTPLLFMGQEWNASTPFQYFTDHEGELGEAIARGRREEFKDFAAFRDPESRETIPDPQAPATFERSKLAWQERDEPPHAEVLALYRELLRLRRTDPVLARAPRENLRAEAHGEMLVVTRWLGGEARVLCVNLGFAPVPLADIAPLVRYEGGVAGVAAIVASSDHVTDLRDDGAIEEPALGPQRAAIFASRR
jgi:maltooligosyltrehalose trehalohydrolase